MNKEQLNLAKEVFECHGCPNLTPPPVFMVGNPESKVWVVGLNPAMPQDNLQRTFDENRKYEEEYFSGNVHGYYKKNFRHVFGEDCLEKFKRGDIASLDLVKCHSKKYKGNKEIEDRCGEFLEKQIEVFKSRLIICNGAPVCRWFEGKYKEQIKNNIDTEKITKADLKTPTGHEFTVIFSGFIGRIDNYAKRRLGIEIDAVLKTLK